METFRGAKAPGSVVNAQTGADAQIAKDVQSPNAVHAKKVRAKKLGKVTAWVAFVAGALTLATQLIFPAAEEFRDTFPSVAEGSTNDQSTNNQSTSGVKD